MGEDLIKNSTFQIVKEDGEIIKIENVKSLEISENKEFEDFLNRDKNIIRNQCVDIILEIDRISRKRFIKLIMAHGIARNGAKDIANFFWNRYGFYSEKFLTKLY